MHWEETGDKTLCNAKTAGQSGFDFNRYLDVNKLHMVLPQLKPSAPMAPLETDVGILWAKSPKTLSFKGNHWGNLLSVINIGLIMVIVMATSFLCLKMKYQKLRIMCWSDKKKHNFEPTTEALPLNDRPLAPPNITEPNRIWPVIPSINECLSGPPQTNQYD